MMRYHRLVLVPMLALLPACGQGESPAGTVHQFLSCIRKGDDKGARAHLVASERHSDSLAFNKRGIDPNFTIGETVLNGDRAEVPVEINKQTPIQPRFVLLREEGAWRVSLKETLSTTLGLDTEGLKKRLQEAIRKSAETGNAAQPPK